MNANGGRPSRLFDWDLNELPPYAENEAMSGQQVSEGTLPNIIYIDSDDDNEPVGGHQGNYVPVAALVGGVPPTAYNHEISHRLQGRAPTIGVNLVGTSSSNPGNQIRRAGYSNVGVNYGGYNLPSPTPPSPQSPSPPPPAAAQSPTPSLSPSPPQFLTQPAPAPEPSPSQSPSQSPSPSSPPPPSPPPPAPPTINCVICWEAVTKSMATKCGHIFCESCIIKSIDQRGHTCPTCRDGVKKEDLIQVYIPNPPPLPPLTRPGCPICMNQLTEEMATQCGHMYCEPCISAALAIKNKCPLCKQKTTYRDLIRVYLNV